MTTRPGREETVDGGGAIVDHRSDLFAVDQVGDVAATGVTDRASDLVDGQTAVGELKTLFAS